MLSPAPTAWPGLVLSTPCPPHSARGGARASAHVQETEAPGGTGLSRASARGEAGWLQRGRVRRLISTLFLEPRVAFALTWLYTCLTVSLATRRSHEAKLRTFLFKERKTDWGSEESPQCAQAFPPQNKGRVRRSWRPSNSSCSRSQTEAGSQGQLQESRKALLQQGLWQHRGQRSLEASPQLNGLTC